jgi:GNAT superfamily N-acetyltransferase
MLFVDPACTGSGVGHALLDQVESEGVTTLECFRDNGPARAFYEHQGWRLVRSYEREFLGSCRAFVLYAKEHFLPARRTDPKSARRDPSE